MSKLIKYRAYLKGFKKMCAVKSIDLEMGTLWVKHGFKDTSPIYDFIGAHAVPLMQDVEVSDKNGKDCFYDDIVKIKLGGEYYNFIVSKVEGNTVLLDPRNHNAIYGFLAVYKDEFEVIGNIHENKELLK